MTSHLPPPASRLPIRKDRRPAVFLDRDGTLNRPIVRDGKPFPPATLDEFALFDGVAEDCAKLKAAGFALVVATNQPDVGRGNQQQAVIESMHTRLLQLVPTLDRVEVCYDPGWGGIPSARRKPAPGMLLDAAQALDLDLARSWMIGDRAGDIEAGHAAGCRTIFIDWGYAEPPPAKAPHFAVKSFAAAAGIVLARS